MPSEFYVLLGILIAALWFFLVEFLFARRSAVLGKVIDKREEIWQTTGYYMRGMRPFYSYHLVVGVQIETGQVVKCEIDPSRFPSIRKGDMVTVMHREGLLTDSWVVA